jgi:predicted short-subunit dehydrogenase-like oxidoreductase (DUF2520 family)
VEQSESGWSARCERATARGLRGPGGGRYCSGVSEPASPLPPEVIDPALPLAGLRFSVLGPGKVGRSLAAWMQAAGAELVRMAGREEGGGGGAGEGGQGGGGRRGEVKPPAGLSTAGEDLVLVAVPDGELAGAAAALAARPQARVALHTAGALDAAALAPLAAAGTAVGSLHPLKAFPTVLPAVEEARGVCFAVDGDPEAVALAGRLAAAWGGTAVEVPAAARPLYHLAATLAAGGVVTLLAAAVELAAALGLPPAVARGYFALARGALARAEAAEEAREGDSPGGAAAAITGPAARGDLEQVGRALAALAEVAPGKVPLVIALARETLHQRSLVAPLTAAQRALLARLTTLGTKGGTVV